ncbi:MAG: UPF0280 family protein [Coriobacteriia bacterium]|nr:UPF0280 family protein [Coriobacteriia bacterium]
MAYEPRFYRDGSSAEGLVSFVVVNAETDLHISARTDLSREAAAIVARSRGELETYIAAHPRFGASYVPVEVEPGAPEIVRSMAEGARATGVGPMAAVAGAIAQRVAEGLSKSSPEIIVENGGDIYVMGHRDRTIAVWAADSPFSGKLGLRLHGEALPRAVCTSSGKIGHSVSFGRSDTVTVLAADGALADAAATALANRVRQADDIDPAIAFGRAIEGVSGVLVTVGDRIGAWGAVELVSLGE